jgi:drug/metabolite transporter (DMT)-like permease
MAAFAVLACFMWASTAPITKFFYVQFEITNDFQRLLLTGMRFTLAGVGLLAYQGLRTKGRGLVKREGWPVIGGVTLLVYVSYVLYAIGLGHMESVKSGVLSSTGTFFVPMFSCLFLKSDRLNLKQWGGVLLGFLGVLAANYSVSGKLSFSLLGEGFVLLHMIPISLSLIVVRKYAQNIDVVMLNGWQFLISGVLLAATGLAGHPEAVVTDAASWCLLLYLAATSAITFSIWFMLLKYHSAPVLEQYKFLVPLAGALISVAILPGEYIGLEMLIAALFCGMGVYIVSHYEAVKQRLAGALVSPLRRKRQPQQNLD